MNGAVTKSDANAANLYSLRAWTRSLTCRKSEIILRMLRVTDFPWPPAPCSGWSALGPGRLPPGRCPLPGLSVQAPPDQGRSCL